MQKSIILNPILSKIHKEKQKEYLKSKILHMKPIVDSKCPESFYYLQNKFSKTQKNKWNCLKFDEDKKIKYNSRDKKFKTKFRPLFKYEHEYLTFTKKEELINVALENLNIYYRLNSKKGNYILKNQLKDYEKAQYYKKNYCKFPSIDFYRTSKSKNGNLCPIFNYCTFNNYKAINEKFLNKYAKKTKNHIMHKTKSAEELFNMNKINRKILKLPNYKTANNYEKLKINEKNRNIYNKITNIEKLKNNFFKNYERENRAKSEKKFKNISENKKENSIGLIYNYSNNNYDKENYTSKKEEENANNEIEKNEDDYNNNNENIDFNDINNKFSKEELSEKIVDFEENTKEKELSKINQEEVKSDDIIENNNYDNKDSNMIKEEEEIEESINNNNNNNKNINEKIESEKNKINEDEFVSNILDDV